MARESGNLSIHSENIFPIIKNGYIQILIFLLENLFLIALMQY